MTKRRPSRFRQVVVSQLREVKRGLVLSTLCMVGFTVAELLSPWPFKIIFDNVLLGRPLPPSLAALDGLVRAGDVWSLASISLAIVLIALLREAFGYLHFAITSRIGYQMVHELRRELFGHLQRLSLSFHSRARSGELLTKVTGDTNTLKNVFGDAAQVLVADLLILVGMFAVMSSLNWQLALVVLASLPCLFYFGLYAGYRRIKESARRQRRKEGRIASRVAEVLTAMSLVQAFGRERYEQARFDEESAASLEESIRSAQKEGAATRTVEMISAVATWVVVLLGSLQALRGRMTPGDILIFAAYAKNIYKPVRHLARMSTKFSKAVVSAERIREILEAEPEIQDDPDAIEASALRGEIAFHDVTFDYGDGRPVLRHVSLTISPGERVALVGASGAGKSTIVSLILRLYDPQEGSISIDGVDMRRYRRESLRGQIGVVLQDALLFGATIKENIAYGKPDATLPEIAAAATVANAHDFISALDDGYDTIVGERGVTLSGGQRQRITLARALIRDAPIVILDEPMAGLDVESEGKVRQALERLMAGRTCLLITHDLQAATAADRVLVIEDGRISEREGPATGWPGAGKTAGSTMARSGSEVHG